MRALMLISLASMTIVTIAFHRMGPAQNILYYLPGLISIACGLAVAVIYFRHR